MKTIFGNLLRLVGNTQPGLTINILRSRKEIIPALEHAFETGKMIGVYCPAIGQGLLLLGVDSISSHVIEKRITFTPNDLTGFVLPRQTVMISEIKSVCQFPNQFPKEAILTPVQSLA